MISLESYLIFLLISSGTEKKDVGTYEDLFTPLIFFVEALSLVPESRYVFKLDFLCGHTRLSAA